MKTNDSILQVLVADDHDLVRFGITTVINSAPDLRVCAEAINGPDCVKKFLNHQPDVAIIDISMPELDGIDTTKSILMHQPNAIVLILTSYSSEDYLERVLRAGAFGYLLKNCSKDELLDGIRRASQRHIVFSSGISEMIKNRFVNELGIHRPEQQERSKQLRAIESLTEREKEILSLVGKGLTSNAISQQLHISPRTVDTHRARIMQKLGLKNKLDVVRFMMEHTLD